jgi:bifunctional DNase/RNase
MKKIKLEIVGLSYSQTQSGAYALVLGEENGKRRLPIIIGGFEAQAIAIELEKMSPTRPLTHDLFKTFADSFGIRIKEIIIHNLSEGIFYSKILCDDGLKQGEIDSRTSDAIAIAVRFGCPIYTYEFILASAGIVIDEEKDAEIEMSKAPDDIPEPIPAFETGNSFSGMSIDELENALTAALENEEYEKASKLRDEINQRKKD